MLTRLVPRFLLAAPPPMLARFSSLLGIAQTGPVLAVTPLLGRTASETGISTPLLALACILLLTCWPALVAERRLDADSTGQQLADR